MRTKTPTRDLSERPDRSSREHAIPQRRDARPQTLEPLGGVEATTAATDQNHHDLQSMDSEHTRKLYYT